MIKGLIASELVFPDVVYFFGPRPNQQKYSTYPKRQKVRGKLRLVSSRPIKLNRVELRLRGSTELNWRDPLKPQHSILAERMQAWRTLRKSKSVLLEDATLPAGVTELGFEVTIPGHLCPSFKSEYLNIEYGLSARILPSATFAKETYIERGFRIQKTLIPRDVAHGQVTGYKVPRLTMRGERPGCLAWEFRVPRWICLEDEKGVEFDGIFKLNDATGKTRVKKILVDVVQEELYKDDKMRASLCKRHLVMSANAPSTYLHPPMDTNISFSFPLQPITPTQHDTAIPRNRRPRASSSPSIPQTHKLHRSNTYTSLSVKSVSPDGSTTTITLGNLTYSLDSPFLTIRHFIRLIVHIYGLIRPICIGLPIKITAKVDVTELGISDADELPTYQSVACDEERLPDYTSRLDITETGSNPGNERNSLEPCCWVREPVVCGQPRRRTLENGYTNTGNGTNNVELNLELLDISAAPSSPPVPPTMHQTICACTEHGCILAEERGLEDFSIIQHQ